MIFWHSVEAGTGHLEVVEAYHTLEDALRDVRLLAWEEAGNHYVNYLMDENTGEAVAIALFGPEMEMVVTCADGRHLTFPMPDTYKE